MRQAEKEKSEKKGRGGGEEWRGRMRGTEKEGLQREDTEKRREGRGERGERRRKRERRVTWGAGPHIM